MSVLLVFVLILKRLGIDEAEAAEKVRFAGSKIRLSCWTTHCFYPVAEAAKLPNHSISAPAS